MARLVVLAAVAGAASAVTYVGAPGLKSDDAGYLSASHDTQTHAWVGYADGLYEYERSAADDDIWEYKGDITQRYPYPTVYSPAGDEIVKELKVCYGYARMGNEYVIDCKFVELDNGGVSKWWTFSPFAANPSYNATGLGVWTIASSRSPGRRIDATERARRLAYGPTFRVFDNTENMTLTIPARGIPAGQKGQSMNTYTPTMVMTTYDWENTNVRGNASNPNDVATVVMTTMDIPLAVSSAACYAYYYVTVSLIRMNDEFRANPLNGSDDSAPYTATALTGQPDITRIFNEIDPVDGNLRDGTWQGYTVMSQVFMNVSNLASTLDVPMRYYTFNLPTSWTMDINSKYFRVVVSAAGSPRWGTTAPVGASATTCRLSTVTPNEIFWMLVQQEQAKSDIGVRRPPSAFSTFVRRAATLARPAPISGFYVDERTGTQESIYDVSCGTLLTENCGEEGQDACCFGTAASGIRIMGHVDLSPPPPPPCPCYATLWNPSWAY